MRFKARPTWQERHGAKKRWHRWFAWYPVRDGSEWVWLEYVQRRGIYVTSWDDGWFEWYYVTEKRTRSAP